MAEHWWPAPEAGDIVWCHFPVLTSLEPGLKPRPALVVKVFDDALAQCVVLVAYGTSQKTDQLRSGEFLIADHQSAAYALAGLSYSTKFSFHNTVELPYHDGWFKVPPSAPHGQTPKLGILHPSMMSRVRAAWDAAQNRIK